MRYLDIEGTGHGYLVRTDDDYKKWPDAITDEEIKSGQYLKSFGPAEDLSTFMGMRGGALFYHQETAQALVAYAQAIRLWPQFREWWPYLGDAANRIGEQNTTRIFTTTSPAPPVPVPLAPDPQADVQVPIPGYSSDAINAENIRYLQTEHPNINWNLVFQKNHTKNKMP